MTKAIHVLVVQTAVNVEMVMRISLLELKNCVGKKPIKCRRIERVLQLYRLYYKGESEWPLLTTSVMCEPHPFSNNDCQFPGIKRQNGNNLEHYHKSFKGLKWDLIDLWAAKKTRVVLLDQNWKYPHITFFYILHKYP